MLSLRLSYFNKFCVQGMLAFGVVREFLQFFNLDFTTAVLDPESNVWFLNYNLYFVIFAFCF